MWYWYDIEIFQYHNFRLKIIIVGRKRPHFIGRGIVHFRGNGLLRFLLGKECATDSLSNINRNLGTCIWKQVSKYKNVGYLW